MELNNYIYLVHFLISTVCYMYYYFITCFKKLIEVYEIILSSNGFNESIQDIAFLYYLGYQDHIARNEFINY